MTTLDIMREEARVRRLARRYGLRLEKTRRRMYPPKGGYALIDASNIVVLGAHNEMHDASLDDVRYELDIRARKEAEERASVEAEIFAPSRTSFEANRALRCLGLGFQEAKELVDWVVGRCGRRDNQPTWTPSRSAGFIAISDSKTGRANVITDPDSHARLSTGRAWRIRSTRLHVPAALRQVLVKAHER